MCKTFNFPKRVNPYSSYSTLGCLLIFALHILLQSKRNEMKIIHNDQVLEKQWVMIITVLIFIYWYSSFAMLLLLLLLPLLLLFLLPSLLFTVFCYYFWNYIKDKCWNLQYTVNCMFNPARFSVMGLCHTLDLEY